MAEAAPPALAGELARACSGCGAVVADPAVARCPAARPGDDVDHLLELPEPEGPWPGGAPGPGDEPFVRYRRLAYPWRVARASGLRDEAYVALVEELDAAVAEVDGHGFRTTPLRAAPALAAALGAPGVGLLVKDETGDVSGSHKARHLFGLAVLLRVLEATGRAGAGPRAPLAIASCGNAALGAAVVARAGGWRLDVFVPPWADPVVLARLEALGAALHLCPRRAGESGDPCVLRYREAVAAGAVPFAAQGPEHGVALDGGATLGYELADQVVAAGGRLDRLYVQVGGGALASSLVLGLQRAVRLGRLAEPPALVAVQAEGAAPLHRAHQVVRSRLGGRRDGAAVAAVLVELASRRSAAMWPWGPEPTSAATGILDDEAYDWRRVLGAAAERGDVVVASEAELAAAHAAVHSTTDVDADVTGCAGLAGLLAQARGGVGPGTGEVVAALLTGSTRRPPPPA